MRTVHDSGDRDFLNRLHRMGSGTIQEICDVIGVTATAVRQRLTRLHERGLIQRTAVRSGRGRPHHVYSLTGAGQRELGDNYGELARILWQELRNIDDSAVQARVLQRIQASLVERYGRGVEGNSLNDRFRLLGQSLAEQGFDVEVELAVSADGDLLPILRENHCPYHELASEDPTICEMEQEVFREILGQKVELTQCCLEGHSCCEFQPVPEDVH